MPSTKTINNKGFQRTEINARKNVAIRIVHNAIIVAKKNVCKNIAVFVREYRLEKWSYRECRIQIARNFNEAAEKQSGRSGSYLRHEKSWSEAFKARERLLNPA